MAHDDRGEPDGPAQDAPADTPPPPGSPAALLAATAAHAATVRAQAAGEDLLELPLVPQARAAQPLPPPGGPRPAAWERLRPLEPAAPPGPALPPAPGWEARHGRLATLVGIGRRALQLLRARRPG